ncbi:MAG: alkaline phosphatase family protein, partial [bacterium]|nr:alkaline phosphatase family protein [bacterium]
MSELFDLIFPKKPEFPKADPKILLIGLDGATLKFIEPLFEEDKMPNLKRMCLEGSYGKLISERPPISPIVWTSIFTGKRREKHNILGFYSNKSELKARRVWEILHHHNTSVGTFGLFLTSPPEKTYNFTIPNWIRKDKSTYPPEYHFVQHWEHIRPFTLRKYVKYGLEKSTIKFIRNNPTLKKKRYNKHFVELFIKTDIFTHLIQKFNPQFASVAYYGTDAFQHLYMHHFKPEWFPNIQSKPDPELADLIPRYYIEFDKQLKRIEEATSGNTNFIFVSDHGARPAPLEYQEKHRISESKIVKLLGIKKEAKPTFAHGFISLKLPGNMIDEVEQMIKSLKVKENGFDLFPLIRKFEDHLEIQHHSEIVRSPKMHHYHFTYQGKEYLIKDFLVTNLRLGMHHIEGFFGGYGPAFKKMEKQVTLSILDIAPLILSIMNIPVGSDMDGEVPKDILNDGYYNPKRSEKPYEETIPQEKELDDIDAEKIKRQ